MEINKKKFCRNLTADERKVIKAGGELAGIDYSAPLLAWKNKAGSEIMFFEVWCECLFESPIFHYVAIKGGIVIVVETMSGMERMYFFEVSEYAAALDFYNKMTEALKNSNAA
ncbi:MAG: hypothetical protein II937_10045 [Bacteroidales bacterium]|nr:hypothetical protein [Bacteroidales bacterium]